MSQVMVYVTATNRDEALVLARTAVEEKLAACANILGEMTSVFGWQGKICEDQEITLILKTRSDLVPQLSARIQALHSYDCACVVALPITAGNPDFLNWIDTETM